MPVPSEPLPPGDAATPTSGGSGGFSCPATWRIRGGGIDLGRARILGILNVTPDSFSDGGEAFSPAAACRRAERLVAEGADLLDIGGESTRPGAEAVPAEEELRRVIPVIREAVALGIPVSIDTSKAAVARAALEAGAAVINDVTALGDPEMAPLAAEAGAGLILMHMQGTPRTMQRDPHYSDLLGEVAAFLQERRGTAENEGVARECVALDPGIGFGKTEAHNLELLARTGDLARLGSPVLVGASRKRFVGSVTGVEDPSRRLAGSLGAVAAARMRGAALFRVHDVAPTRELLAMVDAILAKSP